MSGETLKIVVIYVPTVIGTPRDSDKNSKDCDVAFEKTLTKTANSTLYQIYFRASRILLCSSNIFPWQYVIKEFFHPFTNRTVGVHVFDMLNSI